MSGPVKGSTSTPTRVQQPRPQDVQPPKDAQKTTQTQQQLDTDSLDKGAKAGWAVGNAINKTAHAAGGLGRTGTAIGTAGAIVGAPFQVATAAKDIREAARTGSAEDINRAVGSTTGAASTSLAAVSGGIDLVDRAAQSKTKSAAKEAFKKVAPGASETVAEAAAKSASKLAHGGASAKNITRGATAAATETAKATSTLSKGAGVAGRQAAKQVLREGGEAAAKAATKAVAKSAIGTAAKTAGRFAPGVNVAIAALDTASMVSTLADPKASTGKKVASVITAAGSIAAATNIPVVSQAGAIVSGISSFVGSFF